MHRTYNYAIVKDQQTLWVRSVAATPSDMLDAVWREFDKRWPTGWLRMVHETVPVSGPCFERVIRERA